MEKMKNAQNRILSVDLIKIIAMLSVIGLHTFDANKSWRFENIFYETFVVAVPLFFMCSGYVLFGRTDINTKYAIRKIARIVRFVFIISLLYWGCLSLINGEFVVLGLIKTVAGAFLQKNLLGVCWYLGAMIGLYALLPFLNRIYLQKRRIFNSIIICLFIIEFLIFTENLDNDGKCLESNVFQIFRFWNWLFYFMMGGGI